MVTDDEAALIARSKNGDWEAFAVLIQTYQRMVHSLTYRMTGSAADSQDLAQETFIRAYRALGSYRGSAKFSSWLYRIGLNLCLRWKKRERLRALTDGDWVRAEVNEHAPNTGDDRVQKAMALLPNKQRAAVVLTVFEGMTHSEAASVLGCAEKTLSWHLFAARRRLARILEGERRAP